MFQRGSGPNPGSARGAGHARHLDVQQHDVGQRVLLAVLPLQPLSSCFPWSPLERTGASLWALEKACISVIDACYNKSMEGGCHRPLSDSGGLCSMGRCLAMVSTWMLRGLAMGGSVA